MMRIAPRFKLEDDFQSSAADCPADQLEAVAISFVAPDLVVFKEALHSFLKCDPMLVKLVAFKIVFKLLRREPIPIDQLSFYPYGHEGMCWDARIVAGAFGPISRNDLSFIIVLVSMRFTMRTHVLVTALAAGLLSTVGCDIDDLDIGGSERYTQDFHYSYPLQAGGRLTVENANGSIEISGWDQNTIDISGTKYARTAELRDLLKIEIDHTADSCAHPDACGLRTPWQHGREIYHQGSAAHATGTYRQLERCDPCAGCRRCGAAEDLQWRGACGKPSRQPGCGDFQRQHRGAESGCGASLHTTNGRVRAEEVRGSLEADTSNGGINVQLVKPAAGRPVKLETSNGAIELTMQAVDQNDIRATTSNGGITLHLPSGLGANLTAHASNSSIETEFEVATQGTLDKHHLAGKIGAGGPEIDLNTSNGSIRLMKM